MPTLFLWGEDGVFGDVDNGRRVAELLPQAELVTMPKAGHLPWLDDPRLAAQAAASFLARDPKARSGSGAVKQAAPIAA